MNLHLTFHNISRLGNQLIVAVAVCLNFYPVKIHKTKKGPLSFRLGSIGLGSFGLISFGLVDHLDWEIIWTEVI